MQEKLNNPRVHTSFLFDNMGTHKASMEKYIGGSESLHESIQERERCVVRARCMAGR